MNALHTLGRCAALVALGASALPAAEYPLPDIQYQSFTLSNGLRVLVHEDHKAPIVAFNIWYHVGSKNERPGRTGFAHLFEHLMFNGSEHFNDDYFKVLEKLGATNLNGTTSTDRTNYFENVPTSALDTVLWMESDRMGHLLGAINQARLDEQRGVVQNEKRQGDNQPYGTCDEVTAAATFPQGHPYAHTVIGAMEDLSAASLDDVKHWFRSYYGPNNAVVVLAGDIDLKTAKEKMEKFFGALPASAPITRPKAWVPRMTGIRRQQMQDRVPQAALTLVWNTPELVSDENAHLQMLASVLGGGRSSRLYRRLVEQEQLATEASAYVYAREICGQFTIDVMARPGTDTARIETIVREELDGLLAQGPKADELERVKSTLYASTIRGLERIGGFGGKSDQLASGLVFANDPAFGLKTVKVKLAATPAELQRTGQRWLTDGSFVLEVQPYPEPKPAAADADRKQMPTPGTAPALSFPKLQRATLSNGMKVVLAEREGAPVVQFRMSFEGGTAADSQAKGGAGTASLAMRMLDEGTKTRSARELREQRERLGSTFFAAAAMNTFHVGMGALKANLDGSLELLADVVMNPTFPSDRFERIRKERLMQIAQEESQPDGLVARVAGPVLFGSRHPYGVPFTGSGYASTVSKLQVEDLKSLHQAWFRPGNATLVVAGPVSLAEIMPRLEKAFGAWKGGRAPQLSIPVAQNPARTTIYLVDKPGAIQSSVAMMACAPARSERDEPAVEAMQTILGGMFSSRINMNLREDKHWTYGASAGVISSKGVRAITASAPVQTDRTAETVKEMEKELDGIRGARPVSAEELIFAQKNMTLSLPGSFETTGALAGGVEEILTWGLTDDHYVRLVPRVNALKPEEVMQAARKMIPEAGRTYVVVGDRSKVEKSLRDLGLGEVKVVDAEGRPVQDK